MGFDVNLLSAPVAITAGQVYTVQGTDTCASSLGVGQHENIRVWVEHLSRASRP